MNLLELKRGEKARIMALEGGHGLRRNLENMGVRRGKIVETLTTHPAGGPLVIRIDNITITMGRGMAKKILVEKF